MTTTTSAQACDTDALNSLLRGELSAVETYAQAAEKFSTWDGAAELRRIRSEHVAATNALREKVNHFGGTPADGSGVWGSFAAAVTGTAKVFGQGAALAALKQGEEHGINEYEEALENPDVHPACKDMIRGTLLPRCRQHVADLDRLAAANK